MFQQGEVVPTKSDGFLDNVQMRGGGSFSIQNIILQISFSVFSEKKRRGREGVKADLDIVKKTSDFLGTGSTKYQ